ncbi:hypothetical protein [Aureimonas sp. Leaf324]|uniref:hypothetical protein n=1 Tax=Aureimonas sp. Leaf324 TaxID=1736336 RepID=UPI0006FD74B3|nr:hypothetical protein [Aureimonas sp. Leaf324]KQQ91445.1 hypothetical protein ASF65_02785 [Aureimonas sp. Leaf324]
MTAASATRGPQVADLPKRHEALLVLDIDEVVLHFIAPFCELLSEYGAKLHFDSFKLTGNVRSISTGTALTGHELDGVTERLYVEQTGRQQPVEGVGAALSRLSAIADIVFLTAMTPAFYDQRRELLDTASLHWPMIATERSKGGVVAELAQRWRGPIAFVDDLPPNLEGVRRSVPDVHLVHLMANPDFRPHLPPMPAGTIRAANWLEAEAALHRIATEG